ncbi:COX15/CtaA family protein [Aurantibacter crassamenti]|uniref:COX15/CtaA family protein n=1 Tax=Aurantibacter crassamenti TaxID=1837375 RepID=UPI00193A742C|nr:COX15/CtaA family protein [Aurantibacter crassamenti]MBM1106426.1 COX15/CtaA family protein [Aurantibacter crassamenti]
MQQSFRRTAKISLVLVYLVIIAGAVVRMTGSGMGCPDWPKCFGHYIPPTEISEIEWHPEIEIKKGQIIIVDETLQVSKHNFRTTSSFDKNNWEAYTKHEYAEFNATHTWIEYVNRLFGALAGFGTLILALLSLRYWKTNKTLTIISWLTVFAMGFQGWLGATVVYSVLEPVKITIHMMMALVIVFLLIYLVYKSKDRKFVNTKKNNIGVLVSIALFLTLIQIVLGTQVRQFVDEQIDLIGYDAKELWLQNVTVQFYIHRTFSVLVVLLNVYLLYRIRSKNLGFDKINWIISLIGLEVLTGILMYYMDFPFSTQALHLVLASILCGVQYYLLLEVFNANKSHKSS